MWKITENIFALQKQHHKEAIFTIGNGCLCIRGVLEEGYPGESRATFVHGVFDDAPIREIAPGQSVELLFTRGGSGVHAWELGEALDPGRLDTKRYFKLLDRALQTVLDPCGRSCVSDRLL